MTTSRKLLLLGTLYLSQGLPFGFFTQALPVLLREQGLSLPSIGFTYLLALPWALKFLWAPFVDRYGFRRLGRRRSWILPLQGLTVILLLLVSLAHPSSALLLLLLSVFAINLLAATQDIATDGLAVQLLSPRERGIGNGVQVAGYRIGMILGGGVLLIGFDYLGWANTMIAMAAILAVATIPITLYREQSSTKDSPGERKHALREFLLRPGAMSWLFVLLLYKLGEAFATAMLRPFLVDAGLDMSAIGWLLGTAGFTAGLLGALVGGWGVNVLGRRRALLFYGAIQAVAVTLYVVPALGIGGLPMLIATTSLEHFAGGMATVALFTLMMDACRPQTEGSDYTIQASVVVIATGIAASLSGLSAAALGYVGHFVLSGALCCLALLLIMRVPQKGVIDEH